MKKPECVCFVEEQWEGDERATAIAAEMGVLFLEGLNAYQICPSASEYVLVGAIVMMMRTLTGQLGGGNEVVEREKFREMAGRLGEMLLTREMQLQEKADVIEAAGRVKS